MHIRIDASALREALKRVKASLASSDYYSTHPYVVLNARGCQLVVSTWKKSIRIDVLVPCEVEREGSFAVSYQQLVQAVSPLDGALSLRRDGLEIIVSSALPDQCFVLPVRGKEADEVASCTFASEVIAGATYLRQENRGVTCEACKVSHTEKVEQTYEVMRVLTQRVRLPKAHLLHLLRQVNWLPEYHYRMPCLEGICLEAASGKMSLTGSDGHSLAVAQEAIPEEGVCDWEHRVLVESSLFTKALQPLPRAEVCMEAVLTRHRLVQQNGEPVAEAEPFERAAFLRLTAQHVMVTIPLMNQSIPDYRTLIPTTWVTRITIPTAALRRALQSLASVGNTVACHLASAKLTLEVEHKPQPARHEVPVIGQAGPDVDAVCDASSLLCALDQIATPQVTLEMNGAERPLVLRPGDNGNGNYVFALQCMQQSA